MDDDQWVFNFATTEDGKNGFYIIRLLSTKVLTAGSDGKVILEVIDLDVKGQLWYKETGPYTSNEKSYFIIRNYDYDGVLTPNFDENVYELTSKFTLRCKKNLCHALN